MKVKYIDAWMGRAGATQLASGVTVCRVTEPGHVTPLSTAVCWIIIKFFISSVKVSCLFHGYQLYLNID